MARIKFEFGNCNYYMYDNHPPVTVEAPNVNAAIIKLAIEHDLKNFTAIYLTTEDEDGEEG